jgi:hypothetical protein
MRAIMSDTVQSGGWAAKLFSSALFCLWLSLASVMVWFDLDPVQSPAAAAGQPITAPAMDAPAAATAGDSTPAPGGAPDIA